jgi:hypothetical protein
LDVLKNRAEVAISCLTTVAHERNIPSLNELLIHLSAIYQILCKDIRRLQPLPEFQVTLENDCKVGRPKVAIAKETLIDLKDLGFSWTEISSMLLVSRWTIQRRVKEFGITDLVSYSNISDDELDEYVRQAKEQYGTLAGRSMVLGFLNSLGVRIQRRIIIKSLVRVDPDSSSLRWACLIKRRKYSVPGPNSL